MYRTESNAVRLLTELKKNNLSISVAESCTGGLISSKITDIEGSSSVFWGGFITYSNKAKQKLLSIDKVLLDTYGAVSEETVVAMATGALLHSGASYSVSVSGIAGPGGGTENKPVGTVWICVSTKNDNNRTCKFNFTGDRIEIREKAAESALVMLLNFVLNKTTIDS